MSWRLTRQSADAMAGDAVGAGFDASRRRFLQNVSLTGGAFAIAPTLALPAPAGAFFAPGGPVLSFHLDRPYLDLTGEARSYRPAVGARGGAPVAALSDAELSRYYGVL